MPAALLLPRDSRDSRVPSCEGVVPQDSALTVSPAPGVSCALRSSVLTTLCYLCGPILCACGRKGELIAHRAEVKGQGWRKEGFLLNCHLFVGQNGYSSA